MLNLRQVRKAQPNRHAGCREIFLKVSRTIFGKVGSSKVPKLPLEDSPDHKWHRMTVSLYLGQPLWLLTADLSRGGFISLESARRGPESDASGEHRSMEG